MQVDTRHFQVDTRPFQLDTSHFQLDTTHFQLDTRDFHKKENLVDIYKTFTRHLLDTFNINFRADNTINIFEGTQFIFQLFYSLTKISKMIDNTVSV